MLGALVYGIEDRLTDILGSVFHELELHNKWTGQFFTPFHLCQMMAKMKQMKYEKKGWDSNKNANQVAII